MVLFLSPSLINKKFLKDRIKYLVCRRKQDWNQPQCLTWVWVQKQEHPYRVAHEEALLDGKALYKIVCAIRPRYVKTHEKALSVSRRTFLVKVL